jgi:Nuclease-related domain
MNRPIASIPSLPRAANDSEARAYTAVVETFGLQFPEGRILSNVILPTGTVRGPETSEYDIIFVCRTGIIVFEVKGWSNGRLRSKKTEGGNGVHEWWIERPDGSTDPVRDPVDQGGYKVRYLLEELKGVHATQYTVLTEGTLELDQTANSHVVQLRDLPYLARVTKATAKKFYGTSLLSETMVNAIADAISELSQRHTPQKHLESISQWIASKPSEQNPGADRPVSPIPQSH